MVGEGQIWQEMDRFMNLETEGGVWRLRPGKGQTQAIKHLTSTSNFDLNRFISLNDYTIMSQLLLKIVLKHN